MQLQNERNGFDRRYSYSPIRNYAEHRVVCRHLDEMKKPEVWGHGAAAGPIADMYTARVRIWSTCPDHTLKLHTVREPQGAPSRTLDLLNRSVNHFTYLEGFEAGTQVPTHMPEKNFVIPASAAFERDLGGEGDCFFRAAAFGLNIHGVRNSNDSRDLSRVAHSLRIRVVDAWVDAIKNARRGDETRELVANLISQQQDW